MTEASTATKEAKWYWTYKKGGFHVCDYLRLTEKEAKELYGDTLTEKLLWSELIIDG